MSRLDRLSCSARQVAAGLAPLPSPCVSVCRMSADGSLCEGCFRSLDEIRRWSGLDTLARRVVWSRLLQRAGAPVPDTLPTVKLP